MWKMTLRTPNGHGAKKHLFFKFSRGRFCGDFSLQKAQFYPGGAVLSQKMIFWRIPFKTRENAKSPK